MTTIAFDEVDISSDTFWALNPRARDVAFAELRLHRPVSYHPLPAHVVSEPEGDPGYWALACHADVVAASRDPATFRSGLGVSLDDLPVEVAQAVGSLVVMDAPRHTQLRRLVSRAFTPRAVASMEAAIRTKAAAFVDDAVAAEKGDFVAHIAMPLPLWTVSELMGVPEERRPDVVKAANILVGRDDPELMPPEKDRTLGFFEAASHLIGVASELAAERRRAPRDDLMTVLATSDVDGERLTDAEIGAFFVMLSVAGNDTTRHTTTWAALALQDNPDQADALRRDLGGLLDSAVEEFVRWASPVQHFRRTTSRAVEMHGTVLPEAAKVVLFYGSANRDAEAFPEPWRFDIRRQANNHVGFGGGGAHLCLGAHFARAQLRAVFTELLTRPIQLEFDEPDPLVGSFINGVKRLPYRVVDASRY